MSGQWAFQQEIINDRGALFPAKVYRSIPTAAHVGDRIDVEVEVCGPTSNCPAGRTQSSATAMPSPATHVQAGALIAASVDASLPGHVDTAPRDPQPLIVPSDYVHWAWYLHVDHAGSFQVRIELTPVKRDGVTPLMPTTTITETITVTEPSPSPDRGAGHALYSVWSWLTGTVAGGVTALAGAISAVIGVLTGIRTLRTPAKPGADGGSPAGRRRQDRHAGGTRFGRRLRPRR